MPRGERGVLQVERSVFKHSEVQSNRRIAFVEEL